MHLQSFRNLPLHTNPADEAPFFTAGFLRGFTGQNGKAIRSVAALKPGDVLRTKFSDGEAISRVL